MLHTNMEFRLEEIWGLSHLTWLLLSHKLVVTCHASRHVHCQQPQTNNVCLFGRVATSSNSFKFVPPTTVPSHNCSCPFPPLSIAHPIHLPEVALASAG